VVGWRVSNSIGLSMLKRFAHQGDNELCAEVLRAKGPEHGPRVSLLRKSL